MKKKKTVWWIVLIVSVAVFITAVTLLILKFTDGEAPTDAYKNTSSLTTSATEEILPENPIDFTSLQEKNTDIYAWIHIDNTKVDYPVLQSTVDDDDFYLKHNADKKSSAAGAVYTQRLNQKDFSDPNTVLYGHNMLNGSMFATLHQFRETDFFNANRYMYIYTPGHILKYEIFAAYKYDERHILNSYDFTDMTVYQSYLDSCLNPKTMYKNIREGVELTTKDRIVTLSTCWGNEARYLVQGVLRSDEPTQ